MNRTGSAFAILAAVARLQTAPADAQSVLCEPVGQVATLNETVRDRATRAPLAGALLTVSWPGAAEPLRTRTDSAGLARICAPPGRPITLRVSYHDIKSPAETAWLTTGRVSEHTTVIDVPGVVLRGVVIDQETGAAIANVLVRLGKTQLTALTNAAGQFHFQRVPFGDHTLRTEHLAYAAIATPLEVRDDDMNATIQLAAAAIVLQPIVVTTFSQRLEHVGFYDRQKRGIGTFIGRKQVDAMNVQLASDLLRHTRGNRIVPQPTRRNQSQNAIVGRGNCRYTFVVDGARTLPDFEMDFVQAHAIEGVEIYNGQSEVPADFRTHTSGDRVPSCGVIVLWTRNGR